MPQAPSPNMNIIWPTDNDDNNQWAPIMDTAVRVVIDGHNHAAGNGAKVAISQLAYDADISFVDAGGGKHAITNMKAIAFFPVPTTDVTALAGAFFLNTADNELYFRTVTGVNIQFTNVGALNVGAFAGTIGGDYVGVAALEIFDDATDAYWFQQQVGGAVRQYAKMRSADLSLFEFKVVGASPVPVQAVTLKSPPALAAGYAMIMPAGLPAAGAPAVLTVDSTGAMAIGAQRTLSVSTYAFWSASTVGRTPSGITSNPIPTNTGFDVTLAVGQRIRAIRIFIQDSVTGPTTYNFTLDSLTSTGTHTTIGTSNTSAGSGANQTLTLSGLTTVIAASTSYSVSIVNVAGAGSSKVYGAEIDYDQP